MRAVDRAFFASAVGCHISGIEHPSIYDYSQTKYITINGRISDNNIYLFDNDRKCYLSGHGTNYKFDLYDHGNQTHIVLDIKGNEFSGTEHENRGRYHGYAKDGFVILFDSIEGKYFRYSI